MRRVILNMKDYIFADAVAKSLQVDEQGDFNVTVNKASADTLPGYEVPTGLTAETGQTLADVTLPSVSGGTWTWDAPGTSVGDAGDHDFSATFTPDDTDNYQPVTVEVTVTVAAHVHTFATAWSTDENYHWHAATCEHSNEVSGKDTHSGGTATCTEKAVCSVCAQAYGEVDAANHTGTDTWTKTATTHSSVWSCCGAVKVTETSHSWQGNMCEICGYVRSSGGGGGYTPT